MLYAGGQPAADNSTLEYDNQGKLQIKSVTSKVAVLTGTVAHGGTIPLPSGFDATDCKWTVGLGVLTQWGENAAGGDHDVITCSVNASRVVTCTCVLAEAGTQTGTANYIIVGVK